MSQQRIAREAVFFHGRPGTRTALVAERPSSFTRIHAIVEDSESQVELRAKTRSGSRVVSWSPAAIVATLSLAGAGIGLLLGFAGAWFLSTRGVAPGTTDAILPCAGVIFGGFVGAMFSRAFPFDAESTDDEVGQDETVPQLAAVEIPGAPEWASPFFLPRS
jgi:hypothetical protein